MIRHNAEPISLRGNRWRYNSAGFGLSCAKAIQFCRIIGPHGDGCIGVCSRQAEEKLQVSCFGEHYADEASTWIVLVFQKQLDGM